MYILLIALIGAIIGLSLHMLHTDSDTEYVPPPINNKSMTENSGGNWGWTNDYCLIKYYSKKTNTIIYIPRCEF